MKQRKQGISLIVLIVTIIVLIILATSIILTLSKNNPIESAREAKFKEDVRRFQDELAITIAKEYTDLIGQRNTIINESDYATIKEKYIPSFTKAYAEKLVISNDKLMFTNKLTKLQKKWINDLQIEKFGKDYKYIKNGLILHLDEEVTDEGIWTDLTGNGNDVELHDIKVNDDLSLSAKNETSYASKDIQVGKSNTIEVVLKYDSTNPGMVWALKQADYKYSYLFNWSDNGNTLSYRYRNENNDPYRFSVYDNITNEDSILGKAYLVSITFNSNTKNSDIYINGAYEKTVSINNFENLDFNNIIFFNSYLGDRSLTDGKIYSVRIYDRVLTSEEIKSNYDIDVQRGLILKKGDYSSEYIQDGLIIHYGSLRQKNNNSLIWKDLSSNNNDITLTNIKENWDNSLSAIDSSSYASANVNIPSTNTVEVVARYTSANIGYIFCLIQHDNNYFYLWNYSDGGNSFSYRYRNGSTWSLLDNLTNETGIMYKKYLLTFVFDSGTKRCDIYVNGLYKNTLNVDNFENVNFNSIKLFNSLDNTRPLTDAMIYSFRIYNRKLSAEEIYRQFVVDKKAYDIQ